MICPIFDKFVVTYTNLTDISNQLDKLNGNIDSINKNAVTAFTVQIDDLSGINKTTIFQNTKILTLGSVSVPAWSIGIILASGGNSGINASIFIVDMEGYLYYGIREDNRWIARKLIL